MIPVILLRWLGNFAIAGIAVFLTSAAMAQTVITPTPEGEAKASALTPDILYRILIGDLALQRGENGVAARAYWEAARAARDPRLARRATELALFARQRALALEAARFWSELDPGSDRAKQMLAALSINSGGGTAEVKQQLAQVLGDAANKGAGTAEAFLQLNRLLASQEDKVAIFKLVVELAKPYPRLPEASFAVALAGLNTDFPDNSTRAESIAAVNEALRLRPEWERAALLKAEILAKESQARAIEYLETFVRAEPRSKVAASALAQRYLEQKRFKEARNVFQQLMDQEPAALDLRYAVAVISFQMKDYGRAEPLFEELKQAGYGDPGTVQLYLAQIAEETKRYDEAIARYRAVAEGDKVWASKLRIAALLSKSGKLDEAHAYLANLAADTTERKVQVKQVDAQLLRESGNVLGAYNLLQTALLEFPENQDLLYDLSMAAENLDRISESETLLRRLLGLKPDNAHALNALGYTLVDRTSRAAEGFALIAQAHALLPDDASILDSMGWAHYKLGHLADAEKYLRRALDERPDAEIAAHLGEVLWIKGERNRAEEIWQSQLKETPDNRLLLETVRRFTPHAR